MRVTVYLKQSLKKNQPMTSGFISYNLNMSSDTNEWYYNEKEIFGTIKSKCLKQFLRKDNFVMS